MLKYGFSVVWSNSLRSKGAKYGRSYGGAEHLPFFTLGKHKFLLDFDPDL